MLRLTLEPSPIETHRLQCLEIVQHVLYVLKSLILAGIHDVCNLIVVGYSVWIYRIILFIINFVQLSLF